MNDRGILASYLMSPLSRITNPNNTSQFRLKAVGKKSTRGKTHIKLLESPAILASGVSKTIFLPSDPDERCNRLKLLLQEKHAGNNSDIYNDEIVAIVDKLLEYKCISKKQPKQILTKCNLLQK